MKKTKIIFLRHADTQKDPNLNAALWGLSEKGKKQAEEVVNLPIMSEVDKIYVSKEKKTALTVEPLVKKIKKETISLAFLDEVKRGDKFLTKEEFEAEKIKQLKDLDYHAFGGESGKEALKRFKQGIEQASRESAGKTILVVTHGTILSIYFADLLNVYDKLSERWQKTVFCAYGIVENEVVTKDIV
jgi:2,3-bisphosphoglycerate-dependent phosphoglycerate mutase